MSVWCTILAFAADDHDVDRCARWVPCTQAEAEVAGRVAYGEDARWRYDGARPCTCAAGPLAYQQSHVVPSLDGPRAGSFDLAAVAPHIGQRGDYDAGRDEDGTHLPYLRIGLRGCPDEPDVVVLDRDQVRELHGQLDWFLDNCDPEVSS